MLTPCKMITGVAVGGTERGNTKQMGSSLS